MARSSDYIEHLGQVSLFAACSKRELQKIARAADQVQIPAGKTLVEEGQVGREMFVIVDGKAAVRRGGRRVATLGPGDYFGELAILDKAPRNASVTAESDMTVLVLGTREFNGVLDEVPNMTHKLITRMAHRLREADAKAHTH